MRPGDLDTDQPILSAEQVADRLGIKIGTWHSYVTRGQAPSPDGHVGRTSVWLESTIVAWERRKGNQ